MATTSIPKKILARQHEITAEFRRLVVAHVADVAAGRATEMLEIRDFASQLCIHPTHLSNTIKLTTGQPPCFFFEAEILKTAQQLLRDTTRPAADIATQLTYDPSNFTKFFKRFAGVTPKQYREQVWAARREEFSELLTI
ncbi:helix-turn-helix domain-containing protein [Hymenobacter sp. HMF4947]|uniref:Helix-turn-helix domain-containing protein n=1 Tax=Hymenobacter ginkgonis TaxID=2682976 RepID=A0A7K1TFG1_9BACT|nr:helix-turn-helix domain-containing protein [Hymenobacter ginkgonis]MVN77153.1 helix-turn-helix domain-containing protein [Hymenobacter ginkgonis]